MKQFLTVFSILIVLSGVGVAVYFLFFAHDAPHLEVGNTQTSFSDAISQTQLPSATTTTVATTNVVGNAGTLVAPGLVQITKDPVAAGTAVFGVTIGTTVSTTTATTTSSTTAPIQTAKTDIAVHYIDRASGNVFEYTVFGRSLTRIGNKTLPGIQTASWLKDGSLAFGQFVSDTDSQEHVNTYALPSTGTGGYFLQSDLAQAMVVGSSTIFTLLSGVDSSVGTLAHADGTNPRTLFSTSLTQFKVFPSGSDYTAVTNAARTLDGYVFAINGSGTFTPIIGPLKGLTALPSPSGRYVLYTYVDGGSLSMNVLDRTSGGVTHLPLATLTEKCTWTADNLGLYCAIPTTVSGTIPDDWYQGVTSFKDRIWRVDLVTRTASLVFDPATAKLSVDAVNLTLDPTNHVLVFRNKIDSSLWAYDL